MNRYWRTWWTWWMRCGEPVWCLDQIKFIIFQQVNCSSLNSHSGVLFLSAYLYCHSIRNSKVCSLLSQTVATWQGYTSEPLPSRINLCSICTLWGGSREKTGLCGVMFLFAVTSCWEVTVLSDSHMLLVDGCRSMNSRSFGLSHSLCCLAGNGEEGRISK